MKQNELAKKVKCDQSHISYIINGKRFPSWKLAKKIAKILGTTPEFWMCDTPPEEKRKALEGYEP